ncbi:MAG: response regulator [Planctomycetes bacterium]|nr:response regulator [Planctomycetota bacterium]
MSFPLLRRSILAATVALCAGVAAAWPAATQNLRTQTLTEFEGLPSTETWSLALDREGRVVFGTRVGIGVYDGFEWELHLTSDELPFASGCSAVAVDDDGRLWAAGASLHEGVCVREPDGWVFHRRWPDETGVWVKDLSVLPWEGGHLAVLTTRAGGLFAFDGSAWRDDTLAAGFHGVHDLERIGDELLVVQADGLRALPADGAVNARWCSVALPPGELLAAAYEADDVAGERLWLLSRTWLGYVRDGRWYAVREDLSLEGAGLLDGIELLGDGQGGAYYGGALGLWQYRPDLAEPRSLGPAQGMVSEGTTDLLRDREGNTWIATLRGVTRVPTQVFDGFDSRQGHFADEVTSILELDDGALLLGHVFGLTFRDRDGATPLPFEIGPEVDRLSVRALDMLRTRDGTVWVVSHGLGLGRVDAARELTWRTAPKQADLNALLALEDGRLLLGCGDGLREFDPATERFTPLLPQVREFVRRLERGASGAVYAATASRGLARLERAGEGWSQETWLRSAAGGHEDNVYAVLELADGTLLVGTLGGLMEAEGERLVRSRRFDAEGLPVYALLEDDRGRLWAGTGRGVLRWDGGQRQEYGLQDGLASRESNRDALVQTRDGSIWIGGDRGLSRYREGQERRRATPAVFDLRVSSDGVPVTGAELPSSRDDLEFSYGLVHLSQEPVRVRARLVGFEDDWGVESGPGERTLRYTSLPPGEYRLELQARLAGGAWGPSTWSPSVRILSPIWTRPWFLALGLAGIVALVSGIATLITARRQASSLATLVEVRSADLAASEQRYRDMFTRTSQVQLLVAPEDWRVLDANPAACRYFGTAAEELVGSGLEAWIDVPRARLEAELARLADAGGEVVLRLGAAERGAGPVLELRLSQYELHEQRVVHVSVHDVTRQSRLEEELREAQKLRAVGELASGIAHDFNNLLTTIEGFADLAEEELPGDARLRSHLVGIREATGRGDELVRHLLAFGRKQHMVPEDVEVGELVQSFAALLRRLLDRRIEVVCDMDARPCLVHADRGGLERVLMNLALNARDAMPEGGRLTLRVRRRPARDGAEARVLLAVADTGCGMDEETRARIFEPFFTTKGAGKGTGLGLSTVHGIVGQSGGTLQVTSAPGRGTTLELTLPALPRAGANGNGAAAAPGSDGLRVLLVDDEPGVRLSVGALLRSQGHRVQEAGGGAEALALLDRGHADYDLLLTDVRMPGLRGPELARRARELAPSLRVVYMSGFPQELSEVREVREAVLQKPFSAAQLHRVLHEAHGAG